MSNFLFFINDSLQFIFFFAGFCISFFAMGIGLFLAVLSQVNFIVLFYLCFILISRRNKEQILFETFFEIIYCLIAPIVYLTLIFNTNYAYISRGIGLQNSFTLNALAWIALGIYWINRIIPNSNKGLLKINTQISKLCVYFCFLILSLYIWKDHSFLISRISESEATGDSLYIGISNLLFYIIPFFIGIRRLFLIENVNKDFLSRREFSLFLKKISFISLLIFGLILFNIFQKTDIGIRLRLDSLKEEINFYSRDYKVDKTLIKAIIYTNYKYYLNPMKLFAEYIALGFWAIDNKNNLGWANKFSVSVSAAQIQPVTAQKAILIGMLNYKNESRFFSKEYRMVAGELLPEWKIKDATLKIMTIHLDAISPFQVALELINSSTNIEYCAYILYLYQLQWKNANYDISDKPDILATLYQIGFDKSFPKQNPTSNEYGRRVKEAYDHLRQEEISENRNTSSSIP